MVPNRHEVCKAQFSLLRVHGMRGAAGGFYDIGTINTNRKLNPKPQRPLGRAWWWGTARAAPAGPASARPPRAAP